VETTEGIKMPQLDATWFASQIFWLIIAFATLYYLLSRKALPRLAEILEARQDRIAADLDEAERLRRDAEEALASFQQVIARAQGEAHAMLAETQARLQAAAAERQAELDRDLARQLAEAEARIAAARRSALKELEEAAATAAQAAVERLAGIKVARKAAQAALRDVLEEAA
jgi:F-type H+-transporting ATPase subunit b